jgi:hypothetical protein
VVFAERDHGSGLTVLRDLSDSALRGVPGFRGAGRPGAAARGTTGSAEKMRGRPVVLGYYFNRDPERWPIRSGMPSRSCQGVFRAQHQPTH